MPTTPSLAKGQVLATGPHLTTHIVVVAQQTQAEEILAVAKSWISAGVLEPVLWVPSGWLSSPAEAHGPRALVFGRTDGGAERREVRLLEALSREPHDQVVMTIINPPGDEPDLELPGQIESLVELLDRTMPKERVVDGEPSRSTSLRILSLFFPSASREDPTGIGSALLTSNIVRIESLVINPEDRPTPVSVDVQSPASSARSAHYIMSNTATLAGFWSSMATSPVTPDAAWNNGNVRVVRTNARVVLTHPLMSSVARAVRTTLEGSTFPGAVQEWRGMAGPLLPMEPDLLSARMAERADEIMTVSGLGYRDLPEPPEQSPRKMGFWASLRAFFAFAGDRLAMLPRWIGESLVRGFSRIATARIFGRQPRVEIDARIDLNLRRDDPGLVDAWDFVELRRSELAQAIAAPAEPPQESDDPAPWIALHNGVALFCEGRDTDSHPAFRSGDGVIQVAGCLDDVVPPPNDRFLLDSQCDELLGGDGSQRTLSWQDLEAAQRLESRLSRVVAASRDRVLQLRAAYLSTEAEFFDSQDQYLASKFVAEDAQSTQARELHIAEADGIVVNIASTFEPWSAGPPPLAPELGPAQDASDGPGAMIDPFQSPLDDVIATPADLETLVSAGVTATSQADRARRLRAALSNVARNDAERLQAAESELRTLERALGDLSRWIQSRSSSFAGHVLHRVAQTSVYLDWREKEVYAAAAAAPPEFGVRSAELKDRFVRRVRTGLVVTIGLTLGLWAVSSLLLFVGFPPGFTGVPWWVYATVLVGGTLASIFSPLITYFQDWTRERLTAEDEQARLLHLGDLVRHVRTERVRLNRLHMQVPQRLRALSLWWHYWNVESRGTPAPATPPLPDCTELPHHLRWAEVDALSSPQAQRFMETHLATCLHAGYRSELVGRAIAVHAASSTGGAFLAPDGLARLRSSDALRIVEQWVADDGSRVEAAAHIERDIADQAQGVLREGAMASPPVRELNVDPLEDLLIETDLLEDPRPARPSVDDFLLELAVDAAQMAHHVWGAGVGVQPFTSHFAGPGRLSGQLAPSVQFVAAEGSKLCSSEVAVRIDITDQVQVSLLRD